MNKNNFAILIFIIFIAAGISYWLGNTFIGSQSLKPVEVRTATSISSEISKPEATIFHRDAINPTIPIAIEDNNQNPLGQ